MKGSPFTRTCQQLAFQRENGRADLHTHTTFSDGTCTPAELIERAIRAGLKAIAITDHDSVAGIEPARQFAGAFIEVISGVEMTATFRDQEVHLLGYFVRTDEQDLNGALNELRSARRHRAFEMAKRLARLDVHIEDAIERLPAEMSVGRRQLAKELVNRGHVQSIHGAFIRWLSLPDVANVSKLRWPIDEAISLVRGAGGVASLAHPSERINRESLSALRDLGLQAVECAYPWPTRARERGLRQLAESLGLAITGGSDMHEPGPTRGVGARTIMMEEVDRIRSLAG